MLGIKAQHFTVRGLFVVVLKWAIRIGESRDCGIVGTWAEEHHEILYQRGPTWRKFQLEWATATAKSSG